jgi:Uma2 family endonuclease
VLDERGMLETMASRALKTVADLAVLGEDSRFELIHGEILEKAAPSMPHSEAETYLIILLGRRFDRPEGGRWPGGWWIRTEVHVEYGQHEIFCHDVLGWRRARMPTLPRSWPTQVRPDWVCEILSPGHEKRDRKDKLAVLQRAGVPHYWLVNHVEQLIEVYRHTPAAYELVHTAGAGEVARLEPFDIELATDVIYGITPDEE